jgi:hypothetical protein
MMTDNWSIDKANPQAHLRRVHEHAAGLRRARERIVRQPFAQLRREQRSQVRPAEAGIVGCVIGSSTY